MNVNQSADRLARAMALAGPVAGQASSSMDARALPTLAPHPIAQPENVAANPPSPGAITTLRFDRSHRQQAANQAALPASMPPPAQQMLSVLPPMMEAVVIQNPDEAPCLGGPTTGELALSRAPASAGENA